MKSLANKTSAVSRLLTSVVVSASCLLVPCLGRAQAGADFTVIALPDTQYYSESYPIILTSQMQWVVNNAASWNIQAVLGLGDIVNNSNNPAEWTNADSAYKLLDAAHIPYFATIGNHDYDNNNPPGRTSASTQYNNYFGPARYRSSYWATPYWQSSYPANSNENFYGVLNINGQPYLIMALEFYPRDSVLTWAAQVIQSNADKQVIITTHAYEYFDNTRVSSCNSFDAQYYGLGADNDGDSMWAKLMRQYSNITMVLSGHEIRGAGQDAAGHRMDLGVHGNLVNQILSNYQNMTNGGNGYLRIMRFHPSSDTIDVSTYSPYLNSFLTDSTNQFTIPWHTWTGTGTGSVTGVVKDISTCVALPATISSVAGSTVAGSGGNYWLSGVAPGSYTVTASYPNYTSTSKSVVVGPGLAASGKLFLGTATGQINGVVTDTTGTAVSGAVVELTGSSSASGLDETVAAGSSGTFNSGPIPAGTYQLTASATGYNPSTVTAGLTSGATLTRNLVLSASSNSPPPPPPKTAPGTGTITGQVLRDDTTVQLAGASVAYSGGSTITNSSGGYTLSNVPAGSAVSVTASSNGYMSSSSPVTVISGSTSTSTFALVPNCVAGTVNPSVTMCLPGANASVLNPVHVLAKTTDSHPIALLQIWVDGKKVYEAKAISVDTHESMTVGTTHRVTVQAIDSINQIFKQSVTVTVH
jgi:Carboxypeptidase regulatory-like domain/Calcineurin-like phosphoesterase